MNWLDNRLRRFARWRKWRGLPEPMTPAAAQITREALAILGNADMFGSINRSYPSPPRGVTIKVRPPARYAKKD